MPSKSSEAMSMHTHKNKIFSFNLVKKTTLKVKFQIDRVDTVALSRASFFKKNACDNNSIKNFN
jgi:hypothetical protein